MHNYTIISRTNVSFNECMSEELLCCPHSFPNYLSPTLTQFHLWIVGIVLPIIGLFGLISNMFSAFVYSRRSMRSSLNVYLCALALSDMGVIVTGFMVFSTEALRGYHLGVARAFAIITPYSFPMGMTAQTSSVYLTIAAAIDCFIEVVLPTRVHLGTCTVRRAMKVLVIVFTSSILFNLPHWFETDIFECIDMRSGLQSMDVKPSPMRRSKIYYKIYYTYLYTICMAVGPLLFLILLNSIIIISVLRAKSKREGNTEASSSDTITLILVVCLFIACNSLALIINFLELYLGEALGWLLGYLIDISNLLVVCNSSANFIIYYIFGISFRHTLESYMGNLDLLPRRTLRKYEYDLDTQNGRIIPVHCDGASDTQPMIHQGTRVTVDVDSAHLVRKADPPHHNRTKMNGTEGRLNRIYRCERHQTIPLVRFNDELENIWKMSV